MRRPYKTQTERTPTDIRLHRRARMLEVWFDDGSRFELAAEYLRVYSPSAEVRGHGPGEQILQLGKEKVAITAVEPVGQYAVKLVFDDGHCTGLYSWALLYDLGTNKEHYWQAYLAALEQAGCPRDAIGKEE
ncbi:MAG: DUF971 domain-containing protein [Nitrococcus mobilis]|nr:DUF971 domain-containing protein [Nitrococcus mobilis]